jgi:hypothetical protein
VTYPESDHIKGITHVTISVDEYHRLVERDRLLSCLEDAGVDNWVFYDEALKAFNSEEDEE